MKSITITIIAGLILGIIRLCIKTKLFTKDVYEKTYVCPNCGEHFTARWYQMIYKRGSVYTYNAARLKCPCCHQKDMCSVAREER